MTLCARIRSHDPLNHTHSTIRSLLPLVDQSRLGTFLLQTSRMSTKSTAALVIFLAWDRWVTTANQTCIPLDLVHATLRAGAVLVVHYEVDLREACTQLLMIPSLRDVEVKGDMIPALHQVQDMIP